MGKLPKYAQRFGRVPGALAILRRYPEGLPLAALAAELDAPEDQVREELLAFFTADVGAGAVGLPFRGGHLEFLGSDLVEAGAESAVVVRLTDEGALTELGVEVFGADTLGPLLSTAYDLLAMEPDNAALASAVATLEGGLVAGVEPLAREGGDVAGRLRIAARERRRVRVTYARAWQPGVLTRVIDPYRVVSTTRGYEVDAGPLEDDGSIRTYLVSGIRDLEVLAETFDRPADVAERIAAARAETVVGFVVPQRSRWAVDMLAERVELVREDEDDVELRAHLLPPLAERVGQILVLAGADAYVTEPADLRDAGGTEARRLLAHHHLLPPATDRVQTSIVGSEQPQDGRMDSVRRRGGKVVVVGAAVVRDGRVLAARRTRPPQLAGRWELPGGKLEPGETDRVALARELREELGIDVAVGDRVVNPDDPSGDFPLPGVGVLRVFLATTAADAVPRPAHDHDAVTWTDPANPPTLEWVDADVPAVRAVAAALEVREP